MVVDETLVLVTIMKNVSASQSVYLLLVFQKLKKWSLMLTFFFLAYNFFLKCDIHIDLKHVQFPTKWWVKHNFATITVINNVLAFFEKHTPLKMSEKVDFNNSTGVCKLFYIFLYTFLLLINGQLGMINSLATGPKTTVGSGYFSY